VPAPRVLGPSAGVLALPPRLAVWPFLAPLFLPVLAPRFPPQCSKSGTMAALPAFQRSLLARNLNVLGYLPLPGRRAPHPFGFLCLVRCSDRGREHSVSFLVSAFGAPALSAATHPQILTSVLVLRLDSVDAARSHLPRLPAIAIFLPDLLRFGLSRQYSSRA